ncbi:MAG: hypothetical protein M3P96_15035 [Actinomycetota bacterium]|nr:hypothetical protein [Actinomycetota bacterium]
MQLDFLQPVYAAPGPFATAWLEVAPSERSGHESELRWRGLREHLEKAGAPAALLDQMQEAALSTTHRSGEHGKLLVGAGDELLLDRVLPHPPLPEGATWGPLPHLLPLVRQYVQQVPYILVLIDRAGADLRIVGRSGEEIGGEEVEPDYSGPRGTGQRGAESPDLHSHEATGEARGREIAAEVDKAVARSGAPLVVVAGDVRAVGHLRDNLGERARSLVVDLGTGGRAAGMSQEAVDKALAQAVLDRAAEQARPTLERFEQERGRRAAGEQQALAVEGVSAVIDVLRKAQVDTLLLRDEPRSDPAIDNAGDSIDQRPQATQLWAGPDPFHLGLTEEEVRALGAEQAQPVRADDTLLRAAAATDAHVLLAPEDLELQDGVGAVLRYADASTPAS